MRAPNPETAPVGNSPIIAPTKAAAIPIFIPANKNGIEEGSLSLKRVSIPFEFHVFIMSNSIVSGERSPFTILIVTGKKLK